MPSWSSLCTPSKVYLGLAIFWIVAIIVQNMANERMFLFAHLMMEVPSTMVMAALHIVWILFWAWVLNLICKDGHSGVAWFLVVFPYALLLLAMFITHHHQKHRKPHPHNSHEM